MIGGKGEFYINGVDCFEEYGLVFEESTLPALLSPAPMKEDPEDEVILGNGKIVQTSNPRLDSRTVSLIIYMKCTSMSDFMTKYGKFCTLLYSRNLELTSPEHFQALKFRLLYDSCQQFSAYGYFELVKFILRVTEPDPSNRLNV